MQYYVNRLFLTKITIIAKLIYKFILKNNFKTSSEVYIIT